MLRKTLPLIVSAAIAATVSTQASAELKAYGKANVSLQQTEDQAGDKAWEVNSNASRLGIKGSDAINESLKVIYKAEYETAMDDGNAVLKQRNIYVGVSGNWGTVAAGMHDTPLKVSQGKIDLFNDLSLGDIKNVMVGENRAANSVWYSSPKMNGFDGTIAIIPGEDSAGGRDGLADGTSLMGRYKNKDMGLYVAVAIDSDVDNVDATRVSAQWKSGDFGIGGIIQSAEASNAAATTGKLRRTQEEAATLVSGFYKLDAFTFKAQIGMSTIEETGVTDIDKTQTAIGVDYRLAKPTKVFAYFSKIEEDNGTKVDDNTLAIGLEHKF